MFETTWFKHAAGDLSTNLSRRGGGKVAAMSWSDGLIKALAGNEKDV
jgi:hypothetical protein